MIMGNVYFVRPEGLPGPIKIGFSKTPQKRLASLMAGSPLRLEIVATAIDTTAGERGLHRRFSEYRLHGEWFVYNEGLESVILFVQQTGLLPKLPIPDCAATTVRAKVKLPAVTRKRHWLTPYGPKLPGGREQQAFDAVLERCLAARLTPRQVCSHAGVSPANLKNWRARPDMIKVGTLGRLEKALTELEAG